MKIGFTGTRRGMSASQEKVLYDTFETLLFGEYNEFHHGDAVGADATAHLLVWTFFKGVVIVIHPPIKTYYRAWCPNWSFMHKSKDYIVRDHDIVNSTDILIATPETEYEVQRSGTWATVRYAKKKEKPIVIIYPSGIIQRWPVIEGN